MIAVIHTMSGKHPYPAGVYLYEDKDEKAATDLAVKLCLEQEPPDDEAAVRKELAEDGVYRPEKYAEWSVSVVTHLGVGNHETPGSPDDDDEDEDEQ
jgi:hypothetical protein